MYYKQRIRAFMSYSDKDRKMAGEFKKEFAKVGMDIFLAHEDIPPGNVWKDTLFREIMKREFFIVLLSKNYHCGEYTDHECGMAVAYGRTVIPICVDGASLYGMIKDYQGIKCYSGSIKSCVNKIEKSIIDPSTMNVNTADYIIEETGKSDSYENTVSFVRHLLQFNTFTESQINDLACMYLENSYIQGTYSARNIISEILENNYDEIRPETRIRLDIISKKHARYTAAYHDRNDLYAVSQDLWKNIEIEVHRTDCTFVPRSPAHETVRWFFTLTLRGAIDMARGLAKKHDMKYVDCQYCMQDRS